MKGAAVILIVPADKSIFSPLFFEIVYIDENKKTKVRI